MPRRSTECILATYYTPLCVLKTEGQRHMVLIDLGDVVGAYYESFRDTNVRCPVKPCLLIDLRRDKSRDTARALHQKWRHM